MASYSMRKTTMLLMCSFLFGCSQTGYEELFPAQEQPGKENCKIACANIASLKCWEDRQTQDCELDCQVEHDEGFFWNTECLTSIDSCEEIVSLCKSIIKRNDCG